jgi:hypothetical protein
MKYLLSIFVILSLLVLSSGCGTVFGGHISQCQSHAPKPGQPKREIRPAVLTTDILLGWYVFEIPLVVDFIDGAMYKPCVINDPVAIKHTEDSIHKADSIRENAPFPRAIAISTDAMQYIIPQPNFNIEYIWNHQAIGFYTGLIQPLSFFAVNPIADGQYTDPGTVYNGWAFKLYYKWYDKKRPKHYWCMQLEYKPEWFNNLSFYDQTSEEQTVDYTMNEKAAVYGYDLLRGFEYGEQDAMHLDFFFGIGFHYRVMNYDVTSLNSNGFYGNNNNTPIGDGTSTISLGNHTAGFLLPTPIVGLKFGLNFLMKHNISAAKQKAVQ